MGVLGAAGPTGGRYQCVDDLLAPIRSKMKVLKKFKKRMGLGAYACLLGCYSTCVTTSTVPAWQDRAAASGLLQDYIPFCDMCALQTFKKHGFDSALL
jgi:hypothetical protein